MIIDIHNHHWSQASVPEKFWDGLARRVAMVRSQREGIETTPEEVRRTLFQAFEDPTGEILIKEMDEAGIEITALLALDLGLAMGEPLVSVEEQNRGLAELCRRYPQRLIPFVGIDPRRPEAAKILDRGLKEWGMRGVKFHPGAGWYPNDRNYYPIYEKACEYKVPVLFHTGPQLAPFRSIFSQPIYLDDLTIDFPDLTIIAAHLGVGWWRELASLIEKRQNLYADISGWQVYAMRSFSYFCRTLREILDIVGSGALLFGTDGPTFRLYSYTNKVWARTISELPKNAPADTPFSQEEVEGILWKNASKFLQRKA